MNSTLDKKGLVPAIGGLSRIRTNSILSSLPELQNLPPSPAIPINTRPAYPPYVKTYETNPESLLPGVVEDLTAVARAWAIDAELNPNPTPDSKDASVSGGLLKVDAHDNTTLTSSFDVLQVLKITTHAVRSIRNYLVSLPDESTGTIRAQFRPKSLGLGPASSSLNKPKGTSTGTNSNSSLHPPSQQQHQQPDPLTLIRKSALDVLTVLRELEEGCRLPLSDSAYDDHTNSDAGRGLGSHIRMASPSPSSNLNSEAEEEDLPPPPSSSSRPELGRVHDVDADASVAFSLVRVQGRYESVPVWEDENGDGEDEEDQGEKREYWDERLVLGSGWLYRNDVSLGELGRERAVVAGYLDVVDEVLFQGKTRADGERRGGERGWERERRKVVEKEGRGIARAKGRKVSGGDEVKGLGISMNSGEEGGNRRVTMGMVDSLQRMQISEEPDSMEDFGDTAGEDSEASVDDEELPEWAKRSSFIEDELGSLWRFIRCTNLLTTSLLRSYTRHHICVPPT